MHILDTIRSGGEIKTAAENLCRDYNYDPVRIGTAILDACGYDVVGAYAKRIPKPIIIKDYYCRCPSCGENVAGNGAYCQECGQHLDWDEYYADHSIQYEVFDL